MRVFDVRFSLVLRLAWKDLTHGWQSSICLCVAVSAALLPLLLLYALKFGVVSNLIEKLSTDPLVREIRLAQDLSLDTAWFEDLSKDPNVAFLLPRARYLAASVKLRGPESKRPLDSRVVPTAPGDPLLSGQLVPTQLDEVVLTERAAIQTGVSNGSKIDIIVTRIVDGNREGKRLNANVIGVIPRDTLQTDDVFVTTELEQVIESWREGFEVPELGWSGVREDRVSDNDSRKFASFRLFANDIRSVPELRDRLLRDGLDVDTRSTEIERVIAIESGLSWIFLALTSFSAVGFLLTLGLHLAASVVEKARELSVLSLLGMKAKELALMPSIQGFLIAVCGAIVACFLAWIAQPVVNFSLQGLAGINGEVSNLKLSHFGLATLITAFSGAIAGSVAGYRAAILEPTKGLRRD